MFRRCFCSFRQRCLLPRTLWNLRTVDLSSSDGLHEKRLCPDFSDGRVGICAAHSKWTCTSCHGRSCTSSFTCPVCESWTPETWVKYNLSCRNLKDRHSGKVSPPTPVPPGPRPGHSLANYEGGPSDDPAVRLPARRHGPGHLDPPTDSPQEFTKCW